MGLTDALLICVVLVKQLYALFLLQYNILLLQAELLLALAIYRSQRLLYLIVKPMLCLLVGSLFVVLSVQGHLEAFLGLLSPLFRLTLLQLKLAMVAIELRLVSHGLEAVFIIKGAGHGLLVLHLELLLALLLEVEGVHRFPFNRLLDVLAFFQPVVGLLLLELELAFPALEVFLLLAANDIVTGLYESHT